MSGAKLLLLALLLGAASPASADWLQGAVEASRAAVIPGEVSPEATKARYVGYSPQSRLFSAEVPAQGWFPVEEETARGVVVRLYGPDSPSGGFRSTLSIRFFDKDTPGWTPAKQQVDALRKSDSEGRRSATPVRPLRINLGLARIFEVNETRRVPSEEGPSFEEELHHYVAVVPVGEAYYIVRLISDRTSYLNYRDDFVRFLKSMRAR